MKDTKISELEIDGTKLNWQISESKKQCEGLTKQMKVREEEVRGQFGKEMAERDGRIEGLEREVAARIRQGVEQKGKADELILQQVRRYE